MTAIDFNNSCPHIRCFPPSNLDYLTVT